MRKTPMNHPIFETPTDGKRARVKGKVALASAALAGGLALSLGLFGALPQTAEAEPAPEQASTPAPASADDAHTILQLNADGSIELLPGSDYTSASSTQKPGDTARAESASALPTEFDLRDATVGGVTGSFVTPVKNQNPWGACWSFGSSAAAESSLLSELGRTYESTVTDARPNGLNLSEKHLAFFSVSPLPADDVQANEGIHTNLDYRTNPLVPSGSLLDTGGNMDFATTAYSMKMGPVDESVDPSLEYRDADGKVVEGNGMSYFDPMGDWSVPSELRYVANADLEESYYLPSPASWEPTDEPGISRYVYNVDGVNAIKEQLVAGRGVALSYYADMSLPGVPATTSFLNTDTWAQYTYENPKEGPGKTGGHNHTVCIVGYDDTYSKENFNKDHQPDIDGAFLVKNSWGSVDGGPGNNFNWGIRGSGYFWLSYKDKSIDALEAFDFVTEKDTDVDHSLDSVPHLVYTYRHSFLPADPTSMISSTPVAMANVYEINAHSLVRTVSSQTHSANTSVHYEIYAMNDGATNPSDGELVWKADEAYRYGGYHRVDLETPLEVEAGQKLGVIITTKLADGRYETVQNTFESQAKAQATLDPTSGRSQAGWGVATINKGESFLGVPAGSGYASWTDLQDDVATRKATADKAWKDLGIQDLYDKKVELLKAYVADQTDADVKAAFQEVQAELTAALKDHESEIFYTANVVDNYPIAITTEEIVEPVDVRRIYNPASGEHLFTTDEHEVATRVGEDGWTDETIGWTAPSKSVSAVKRLLNPFTGEHLYTMDANEVKDLVAAGWQDEGVKLYSDDLQTTPVYRLYNPYNPGVGEHHYTTDANEVAELKKLGWQDEGAKLWGLEA